jgi:hypothetical protein
MFRMARITAYPQETVIEAPASEVILELLLDIPGHRHTRARPYPVPQMGLERGVVFLDSSKKASAIGIDLIGHLSRSSKIGAAGTPRASVGIKF